MPEKLIKQFWMIFLSGVIFIAACEKIDISSRPYVAEVNGARIYLDEFEKRLAQKKATLPKEFFPYQGDHAERLKEEVLDDMITEKIMYLRARELGLIVGSEELEKRINDIKKEYGEGFPQIFAEEKLSFEQWKEELKKEMLFEKLVTVDVNARIIVSDNEAQDYYNKNSDMYKTKPQVRVAQIVVRDLATAREALQKLKAGADFFEVAREKSIGPEAGRGGDLGFITRDVMPEPLDKTIFSLRPSKISPVVKSPYGFHIFKVLEIQPAKIKNFAECKQDVITDIRLKKEEVAFGIWLAALKRKTIIKKKHVALGKQTQSTVPGGTDERK
ncbi:MAG: peptidyl-prolyl cis-trans isomerase [Smithella sp.]